MASAPSGAESKFSTVTQTPFPLQRTSNSWPMSDSDQCGGIFGKIPATGSQSNLWRVNNGSII